MDRLWRLAGQHGLEQGIPAIDYDLGIAMGTQEPAAVITPVGVAFWFGFAFADLVIYIPMLGIGLAGHWREASWAPYVLGGALGITVYWPVVVLAAAFGLATRIPLMEVETSTDDYLRDGDPEKIAYNEFRDQFGRDQVIFVVVEPPEIFDLAFLEWLRDLHEALEDEVPYVYDVSSLVNIRSIYAEGDILVVVEAMKMENEFKAPFAGVVSQVAVSAGASIEAGSTLVVVEPATAG